MSAAWRRRPDPSRGGGRALLVLGLLACSGTPPRGDFDADALPRLALAEVQRIGSVENPDLGFSLVTAVDVDRDGRVFVVEGQDLEIRVYDREAALVRRIGRRGEGPGEFRSAPFFGVVGDTVWAFERPTGRLTLFDRRGTVLSTATVAPLLAPVHDSRSVEIRPRLMRADGRFVGDMTIGRATSFRPRESGPSFADTDSVPVPIVLLDPSGIVVDTVGFRPRVRLDRPPASRVEVGSAAYYVPRPLYDGDRTEVLEDGTIVVEQRTPDGQGGAEFAVTRRSFGGDTLDHRVFRYRPRPYTDAVLDTLAARAAARPGGVVRFVGGVRQPPDPPDGDATPVIAALREEMEFPRFQPPVQGRHLGDDGGLWLRREDLGGPTHDWIVLDPTARPRGIVTLPRHLQVLWSRAPELIAVETDELGVPWVVRYRIGEGSG